MGMVRIKKTEWNQEPQQYETTIYIYSQGDVHYEKNAATGIEAIYVYGPAGRIAKKVGEETMFYHADHLGSTRLLTDQTGTPVTAVEYSPFGEEHLTGARERYLFTGQEMDSTGLYYYKARYYDLETGRFLTRDKWTGDYKRPQTLNKYVYCLNNPLKYTDPDVRKAFEEGWKESYTETSLEFATPEAAQERLKVELDSLEGDLQCLMDLTSDELINIPEAMMETPWEVVEALQAAIYVAEEFYNLTCTDKYGPPPKDLKDLCKKKEEGTCSGTVLLCIFVFLSALLIFMKSERRRLK